MSAKQGNVRYWHLADILFAPHMSAFGVKRTCPFAPHMLLLTQSGHVAWQCKIVECLFVVTDAATKIVRFGHESYFRNWSLIGARPWKHVADFGDLTF